MNRKEFIRICGISCLSGAVLATVLQSCGTQYFASGTMTGNRLKIGKNEFIISGEKKSGIRKYILVRSSKYAFPVAVYRHDENTYSALLMECTHKGCELHANNEFLTCPCHGSEFSNKGVVQNPPAEADLKTFEVTTDNENLYILF